MIQKKILLVGKNGQLARSFIKNSKLLDQNRYKLFSIGRETIDLEKSSPEEYRRVFKIYEPDLVINAAAFTNVDDAEANREVAIKVNGISLEIICKECDLRDIPIIHFSTDYVFDGGGNNFWQINSPTKPISIYGESKLLGEQHIRESKIKSVIFRISWVFGKSSYNFIESMLRLADMDELKIVKDQWGGPTSADSLTMNILNLIPFVISNNSPINKFTNNFPWGTYHFQGQPIVSRFDFAKEIFNLSYRLKIIDNIPLLKPIKTTEFPTPAKRPLNTRLDCSKTIEELGINLPSWKEDLKKYLLKR